MRKVLFLVAVSTLLVSHSLFAQILSPVKWEWKAEPTGKGDYQLIFSSKIDKGWHVYSQFIANDGPVPTSFIFTENKDVQLIGKPSETGAKMHEGHDPVFDMQLKYFEGTMVCAQKVKVLKDTKLKGTLEYMVCDDSRCLPPENLEFEFDLKANTVIPATVRLYRTGGD
jgi:thiol:disulfide interchange protein DsbD